MTKTPHSIDIDCFAFEAIQQMSQHNIHHLPVTEQDKPIGVLTTTDLIRSQQEHPVFLISHIHRQHQAAGLQAITPQIQQLALQLAEQHIPSYEVSSILTSIMDALVQSWLNIAEQQLGPAPCVYSWLVFGSQARRDMLPSADQDNALLLEKEPSGAIAEYFSALADIVCHGLASSGQALCDGQIMAANPELRLSLKGWSNRFAKWLNTPDPQALLNSSIFSICVWFMAVKAYLTSCMKTYWLVAKIMNCFYTIWLKMPQSVNLHWVSLNTFCLNRMVGNVKDWI